MPPRSASAPVLASTPALSPASGHRRDIQGLRAVAVLLVVADHAFGVPAGGFVGVDVFFVLSGFLMTSVLYREFDRTGRIRFLAFYRRRARRLLPAAAATVAVTVVGAWLLFPSGRFQATLWDAASALGFVSNWRFASLQTDYFQQGSATSPLQHFWSLSVEEQYYLVWPLGLLVLCVLAASSALRRPAIALLTFAATLLLFVLALTLTEADPGSAYFVTPARLWELSLGGAVALALPLTQRASGWVRSGFATLGLAGILAAAVITPSGAGFPAPWAAVAVVSTALVLAFPWEPARLGRLHPLTNRVSGYIGDISYSLYLWHFPALVLIAEAFRGLPGDGTPLPAAIAVVVSGGLAALSYRFVEEPVRRSQWLEPRRERSEASVRRSTAVGVSALAVAACASVAFALVLDRGATATAGGGGTAGSTPPAAAPSPAATAPATDTAGAAGAAGAATAELQAQLTQALAATSWPQLQQDPGDPVGVEVDRSFDKCSSGGYSQAECSWGDPNAPHTAVLVGDSIAAAYLPALAQVVGAGEWRLTSAALYACPFVDVRIGASARAADTCANRRQTEAELVRSMRPDLLIVSNTYLRGNDVDTGKKATLAAWRAGFDRQLAELDGSYGKLVVLPPPPYGANLADCYSPRTAPAACVTTVSASDYRSSMAMLGEVAADHGGAVLDNLDWFCVDGRCPAFAGDTLVKRDTWHPISTYVLRLVPAMQEAFASLLAG